MQRNASLKFSSVHRVRSSVTITVPSARLSTTWMTSRHSNRAKGDAGQDEDDGGDEGAPGHGPMLRRSRLSIPTVQRFGHD